MMKCTDKDNTSFKKDRKYLNIIKRTDLFSYDLDEKLKKMCICGKHKISSCYLTKMVYGYLLVLNVPFYTIVKHIIDPLKNLLIIKLINICREELSLPRSTIIANLNFLSSKKQGRKVNKDIDNLLDEIEKVSRELEPELAIVCIEKLINEYRQTFECKKCCGTGIDLSYDHERDTRICVWCNGKGRKE